MALELALDGVRCPALLVDNGLGRLGNESNLGVCELGLYCMEFKSFATSTYRVLINFHCGGLIDPVLVDTDVDGPVLFIVPGASSKDWLLTIL